MAENKHQLLITIGAALSGSPAYEKHVVLCELMNGWRFAMELDKNEYRAWKEAMK